MKLILLLGWLDFLLDANVESFKQTVVLRRFLAVFLDLPAPWDAIKTSKKALKVSDSNVTSMQFVIVREQPTEVKNLHVHVHPPSPPLREFSVIRDYMYMYVNQLVRIYNKIPDRDWFSTRPFIT